MMDKKKLEAIYTKPFSFKVFDNKDAAMQIVIGIVKHYFVSLEDENIKVNLILDGDSLKDKSFYKKTSSRIQEELEDIDKVTEAYYDLIIELYLGKDKIVSFNNEISISLDKIGFLVEGKNESVHWHNAQKLDRYANMDYAHVPKKPHDVEADPFYVGNFASVTADDMKNFDPKTFDPNTIKAPRGVGYYGRDTFKPRTRMSADPRFAGLDLNKRNLNKYNKERVDEEQLTLKQDTELDQDLTQLKGTSAKQKLGKQTSTDQVSKSVQSTVDKMSYQKAYDTVEEIKDAWDDADPYHQYTDTLNLSDKWYGNNVVLVDSFDVIDKIYYAADLTRKILDLEEEIADTKSRTALAKLKKELEKNKSDLEKITPEIDKAMNGAKGYDAIKNRADDLQKKMDNYIDDYRKNLADWKAIKGKLKKMSKMVETLDALRIKYTSNRNDVPALLPRYKALMEQPIPTIIDIENLDNVNLSTVYTTWRNTMQDYKKNLNSFNDAFIMTYNILAPMLAVKAKSRSLF